MFNPAICTYTQATFKSRYMLSIFTPMSYLFNHIKILLPCIFSYSKGVRMICVLFRDATGTVQKSKKVSGDRGSGGRAPSGVQGQRPGGGSRWQSPLEARAFSQSELPRKPPIDTHGRYTYNTCTGGEKKGEKVGRSEKVGKTASLIVLHLQDPERLCEYRF